MSSPDCYRSRDRTTTIVEIEAAPKPLEQQSDELMEEAAASVMCATTTTTAPTCHSQRIENNERAEIVATVHECEWYKYETPQKCGI